MRTDESFGLITLPKNINPSAIVTGTNGNVWFIDINHNAVAVHIRLELVVTPSSLTFGSAGQTQSLTVTESKYRESWTAVSSNPAVATVAPGGASNTFNVTAKGAGTCSITVNDDQGNSFPVATTVQ